MKKTKNGKMLVAAGLLLSIIILGSCNKDVQNSAIPAQNNGISDDGVEAVAPVAIWKFDSSWTEAKQSLIGRPHNKVKFSSTADAYAGKAAFLSKDSGYVSYNDAGTALPNLTTGLTVDFWMYAYPKTGGAQCVWCLPQTGAFWPTQHVLLDAYNTNQGDSGLIKVMFKANKAIPYNEQWTEKGGIPNFYRRWTHVQYSYNGSTSKYTLKVNGKKYFDGVVLYDSGDTLTRQPLGNLNPNPGTHVIVIVDFQNTWDPTLFGAREPWMLGFKGRIDNLKIYDTALF
jgi:hypothetical protein